MATLFVAAFISCNMAIPYFLRRGDDILQPSLIAVALLVALMMPGAASGQDYPSRPIRIITAAAGGGSDFTSRVIAQGITGALGQPVIVDNRTAILAAEAVSKAPPDGYSLLVTGTSFWVGPLLQKVPYDAVRDFLPVVQIAREVNIVAVHPSVPARSIRELIALAKARPGELNNAWTVAGSSNHLSGELFKAMAGVNIVGIAYKGSAAGLTALISGEVQLAINDSGIVAPHVKSGKLRALAVTSAEPSALVPGLPTVAASGLPGYEAVSMTGLWAPGKTPATIVNRLNQEIVRFVRTPEAKEKFLGNGAETVGSSPEQFASAITADIAKWGKVIKDAGIKVQ